MPAKLDFPKVSEKQEKKKHVKGWNRQQKLSPTTKYRREQRKSQYKKKPGRFSYQKTKEINFFEL